MMNAAVVAAAAPFRTTFGKVLYCGRSSRGAIMAIGCPPLLSGGSFPELHPSLHLLCGMGIRRGPAGATGQRWVNPFVLNIPQVTFLFFIHARAETLIRCDLPMIFVLLYDLLFS